MSPGWARAPRLAAADAQFLWLSAKVPNDQMLVYVFDGEPDLAAALDEVRRNAEGCDDLGLRVRDDRVWRYPRWVRGQVDPAQFVVHEAEPYPSGGWRACLGAVAAIGGLDATRMAWRVHVFRPAVVVVQISHALGDGSRSAALAAALLGRPGPLPPVTADRGHLLRRGIAAARAHRDMLRDIEAGALVPPPAPRPARSVNARPAGRQVLRTLVVDRSRLHRPTVTVAALSAVAEALGGYLADRGEDISRLGAEVPIAGPSTPEGSGLPARNNFRNAGVGLHPELDSRGRAARIAADLDAARRRAEHPAARASAAAFAAVPAPVLRWGTGRFDPAATSTTVSGNTVVSSVYRGPADLTFGGCPVALTAGYPALSPMMSLTHGVHGIGEVVAVSVRADPTVVDVEEYLDRLADALGCPPQR